MEKSETTPEREALEAIWLFLEDELGQFVTPSYAECMKKVADVLGKTIVLEERGTNGMPLMFYVKEIQS
jgi:hypothetical protein